VFASRDKASMIVGALLIVVFVAASLVSARARLNLHIGIP
jgi:hypothetical protein